MRAAPGESEETLLARLRSGDERALAALVDTLHGSLVSLASSFTSSPALAEDIVQETWLAVIRGLGGLEGRSPLRTWIFSILVRRARTMPGREARRGTHVADREPTAEWEPGRGSRGLWEETPMPWTIEDRAAIYQTGEGSRSCVRPWSPDSQRQVVLPRDVEDVSAADVCNILELSEPEAARAPRTRQDPPCAGSLRSRRGEADPAGAGATILTFAARRVAKRGAVKPKREGPRRGNDERERGDLMECYEAIDLMEDAIGGRLPAVGRPGFEEHMVECDACRNYMEKLRVTIGALERLRRTVETNRRPDELSEEFKRQFSGRGHGPPHRA